MRTGPQRDTRADMDRYAPRTFDQRACEGEPLTDVETDILTRIVDGAYDREIAGVLGISERTVRRHLAAARRKLGARTRVHAVVLAAQAGLIRIDEGTPDA